MTTEPRLGLVPGQQQVGVIELSVVVPIFNEEANIETLFQRLRAVLSPLSDRFEIIAVNDGSQDQSLALLRVEAGRDPRVRVVSFSRNFGHQIAITAGMEFSRGDAVVVIDADLQDPPELIGEMLKKWKHGFDIVYAVRVRRKGESWLKLLTAKIFYRFLKAVAHVSIPVDTGDFRLLSRRAVLAMLAMPEQRRYVRGMVSWLGFPQAAISYERSERQHGESHYPFRKMFRFAIDGITSFSYLPLSLASYLGFACAFLSFLLILYTLWIRFVKLEAVRGWASSVIITLFIGGVQLIMIGILGEYIGRILEEMKKRPLYIVQEKINC